MFTKTIWNCPNKELDKASHTIASRPDICKYVNCKLLVSVKVDQVRNPIRYECHQSSDGERRKPKDESRYWLTEEYCR
jgi:hypothetical protein